MILHDLLLLQAQQAELDVEAALLLVRQRRRKRQRKPKAFWVRPWLQAERRLLYGHYDRLMTELRREDQQFFFNFLRMSAEMFDELINRVGSCSVSHGTSQHLAQRIRGAVRLCAI